MTILKKSVLGLLAGSSLLLTGCNVYAGQGEIVDKQIYRGREEAIYDDYLSMVLRVPQSGWGEEDQIQEFRLYRGPFDLEQLDKELRIGDVIDVDYDFEYRPNRESYNVATRINATQPADEFWAYVQNQRSEDDKFRTGLTAVIATLALIGFGVPQQLYQGIRNKFRRQKVLS